MKDMSMSYVDLIVNLYGLFIRVVCIVVCYLVAKKYDKNGLFALLGFFGVLGIVGLLLIIKFGGNNNYGSGGYNNGGYNNNGYNNGGYNNNGYNNGGYNNNGYNNGGYNNGGYNNGGYNNGGYNNGGYNNNGYNNYQNAGMQGRDDYSNQEQPYVVNSDDTVRTTPSDPEKQGTYENPDKRTYVINGKTVTEDQVNCGKCGARVAGSTGFCPYCGNKL